MGVRFLLAGLGVIVALSGSKLPGSTAPAGSTPAPSSASSHSSQPAAWPVLQFALPQGSDAIGITAVGNDAATNQALAVELAAHLEQQRVFPHAFFIPTTFSLADVGDQCTKGNIDGSLVVLPPLIANGAANYFLFVRNWTRVSYAVAVVECVNKTADITWVSDVQDGIKNSNSVSLLPLVAVAGIYSILAPSHSKQTDTTQSFASPSPMPSTGYISKIDTTETHTSNPSASNSITTALLGYFAAQSANVGAIPNVDAQTSQAIERASDALARGFSAYCTEQKRVPKFCNW